MNWKKKTVNFESSADILDLINEVQEEIVYVMMRVVFEYDDAIYEKQVPEGQEIVSLYSPRLDRVFHSSFVGKSADGTRYLRFTINLDDLDDLQTFKAELESALWEEVTY